MKKLLLTLVAALGIVVSTVSVANAAEGGIAWDKAPNRTNDVVSLRTVPSCSSTIA